MQGIGYTYDGIAECPDRVEEATWRLAKARSYFYLLTGEITGRSGDIIWAQGPKLPGHRGYTSCWATPLNSP